MEKTLTPAPLHCQYWSCRTSEGVSYLIGEQITCHNEGCDVVFAKRTHNQLYHDEECCRLATNAKIMKKYYEKRARRLNLKRICECGNELSRYNDSNICNSCAESKESQRTLQIKNMLSNVIWLDEDTMV